MHCRQRPGGFMLRQWGDFCRLYLPSLVLASVQEIMDEENVVLISGAEKRFSNKK